MESKNVEKKRAKKVAEDTISKPIKSSIKKEEVKKGTAVREKSNADKISTKKSATALNTKIERKTDKIVSSPKKE